MATADVAGTLRSSEESVALAGQLRKLARIATFIAMLTSPAAYLLVPARGAPHRRRVAGPHRARRHRLPGPRRPHHPAGDPMAEPLRHRGGAAARGGRGQPAPRLDVALLLPRRDLGRRPRHDRLPLAGHVRRDPPHVARHRTAHARRHRPPAAQQNPPASARLRLLPVLRQLLHLHGPDDAHGHLADPRLRARRCRVGREARRRPRTGRGEGRGAADRHAVAVRRGVRAGRRQARARTALPRRAGHRQDDAREGDRDRLQLAVRVHPGLGLRADVHRHRRAHRSLPRAQGEAPRAQVGRPVHRLHRRDRRRRLAATGPAGQQHESARRRRPDASTVRTARSTRAATSSTRAPPGASTCSTCARPSAAPRIRRGSTR